MEPMTPKQRSYVQKLQLRHPADEYEELFGAEWPDWTKGQASRFITDMVVLSKNQRRTTVGDAAGRQHQQLGLTTCSECSGTGILRFDPEAAVGVRVVNAATQELTCGKCFGLGKILGSSTPDSAVQSSVNRVSGGIGSRRVTLGG